MALSIQAKLSVRVIVCMFWACLSQELTTSPDVLEKVRDVLLNPPSRAWAYEGNLSLMRSTHLTESRIRKGIEVDGKRTRQAIRSMLAKALKGRPVKMYVFGESVSVGADLGRGNLENIFHYAVANWWNETIGAVTGGNMSRNVLAVGGVSTTWFDRCWREYLQENETFDLAVWEFNINDIRQPQLEKSLERFTRSVLEYDKSPGLMFSIFFHRSYFTQQDSRVKRKYLVQPHSQDWLQLRHDLSEKLTKLNAAYYDCTCINIETAIKDLVQARKLQKGDLFTKQHPSKLAHAQMAQIMIHYIKSIILKTIDEILEEKTLLDDDKLRQPISLPLARPVSNSVYKSLCYHQVLPNFTGGEVKHDLFSLPVNTSKFTSKVTKKKFANAEEVRHDTVGGYILPAADEYIVMNVSIPEGEAKELSLAVWFVGAKQKLRVVANQGKRITERTFKPQLDLHGRLTVFPVNIFHHGNVTVKVTSSTDGDVIVSGIILC